MEDNIAPAPVHSPPSHVGGASPTSFRCERAIWVLRDDLGGQWLATGVVAPPGEPGGVMPDIVPAGEYSRGGRPHHGVSEAGNGARPTIIIPAEGAWQSREVPLYVVDEALLPPASDQAGS